MTDLAFLKKPGFKNAGTAVAFVYFKDKDFPVE